MPDQRQDQGGPDVKRQTLRENIVNFEKAQRERRSGFFIILA